MFKEFENVYRIFIASLKAASLIPGFGFSYFAGLIKVPFILNSWKKKKDMKLVLRVLIITCSLTKALLT
jgi:hypothetical protein